MTEDELAELVAVRALTRTGAAKAIRKAASVSLLEIAKTIGSPYSTVWRWENATRAPRGAAALRYKRVLDRLVTR